MDYKTEFGIIIDEIIVKSEDMQKKIKCQERHLSLDEIKTKITYEKEIELKAKLKDKFIQMSSIKNTFYKMREFGKINIREDCFSNYVFEHSLKFESITLNEKNIQYNTIQHDLYNSTIEPIGGYIKNDTMRYLKKPSSKFEQLDFKEIEKESFNRILIENKNNFININPEPKVLKGDREDIPALNAHIVSFLELHNCEHIVLIDYEYRVIEDDGQRNSNI